ncbi:hypothetical protein KCV03_g313, partial [Aureobasidium melanogenum]
MLILEFISWQVQRAFATSRFAESERRAFLHTPTPSSSSSLRQRLSSADLWAHITFAIIFPGNWLKRRHHHHESTRRRTASGLGLPS